MARLPCPIPQVEEALDPYIHTRQETLQIRQIITVQLKKQLQDGHKTYSHLDLTTPSTSLTASHASTQYPGLYKRYLQALQAHHQASAHYETVKSELQAFQTEAPPKPPSALSAPLQEHLHLLRQRRQLQKLEIIQVALTSLLDAAENPTHTDTRSLLARTAGDPPQPPLARADRQREVTARIDAGVLRLKKELLIAQARKDEAVARRAAAEKRNEGAGEPGVAAQVSALRGTRDALIKWVEGELAKVPEEESVVEEGEVEELMRGEGVDGDAAEVEKQVQALYTQYVEKREGLIRKLEETKEQVKSLGPQDEQAAPTGTMLPSTPPGARSRAYSRVATSASSASGAPLIPASDLLPYLPALLQASHNEAQLMAQTAHLRRQLAASSEETARTLQRLAGESYLVPPGADNMKAWVAAVDEANKKTHAAVTEQADAGLQSMSNAQRTLDRIRERKAALEGLKGSV